MDPFAENAGHPQYLPLSIARALWKRKFLVLSVWVLISLATAVVVMMLPAVYRAETVILIEGQRIPERYVPTTMNEELRNRLSVLTQQIKSYETLLNLIEEFNLYRQDRGRLVQEEIIEQMREDISVDLVRGFGERERQVPAFTISYQGPNPQVVARVANAIRERFLRTNLKMREDRAVGTEEFLESQLRTAARDLERQEARLADYRQKNSGQLPDQVDTLMSTLNRLQLQLDGVQDSIRQNYQNKIMLENSLATAENSALAFSGIASQRGSSAAKNPKVERSPLERDVDEAAGTLADLQSRYSDDHPDVRRAVGELERRKRVLAAARASGGEGLGEESGGASEDSPNQPLVMETLRQQQERVENLKVQLSLVEDDLRARNQDRDTILRRIGAIQARLETLPLREQELAKVIRDYDISKANYQSLLNKRMEAEVASEMESRQQGERFTLLDPARTPQKPIKPQRELLIGGGVLAGLLLGAAIGFGFERRSNVLLGEWELPGGTAVLGRVPPIEAAAAAVPKAPKAPEVRQRPWRRPRLRVRFRSRKRQLVLAPTILLCLLGVIIATSMYTGWSPF